MEKLQQLIEVVASLRDPEHGCPWDLEQTHQSLLKYLQEETYEFKEAVLSGSDAHMEEELGDLLLQVLLHARLGEERQSFSLETVAQKLSDKLIRRHPHVFNREQAVNSAQEVEENWQKIKAQEKGSEKKYAITKRELNRPALSSAHIIGQKTRELNFDWEDASQVVYKVEEEWQELKEEIVPGIEINQARIAEELGDFLFSTAQLARHIGVDPEEVLRAANEKFIKRFNRVEDLMKADGFNFGDLNQKQLDNYWNRIK